MDGNLASYTTRPKYAKGPVFSGKAKQGKGGRKDQDREESWMKLEEKIIFVLTGCRSFEYQTLCRMQCRFNWGTKQLLPIEMFEPQFQVAELRGLCLALSTPRTPITPKGDMPPALTVTGMLDSCERVETRTLPWGLSRVTMIIMFIIMTTITMLINALYHRGLE